MSTVLETIVARHHGLQVLGLSLIANRVGAAGLAHADVIRIAGAACVRLGTILDGVISSL